MIDVDYNEYKATLEENMQLIQENHKLKEEIERLNNIIKKVREYLRQKSTIVHIERTNDFGLEVYLKDEDYNELLEILDKGE